MNEKHLSVSPKEVAQEESLRKARERVMDALAKNMDLYGVTHSAGHLYGTLLFQEKPMNLDEMGEALGMSKTSMSTSVRGLMDLNMVKKIWMKGARKDYYEIESDWHQIFIDFFGIKWRKAIDDNVQALRKSLQEIKSLQKDAELSAALARAAEMDVAKIERALEYYDWLSRLIDVLESHEIFSLVPKSGKEQG